MPGTPHREKQTCVFFYRVAAENKLHAKTAAGSSRFHQVPEQRHRSERSGSVDFWKHSGADAGNFVKNSDKKVLPESLYPVWGAVL